MTNGVRYAFFDFDGTLTKHDSLLPFLRYCVGTGMFLLKMPVVFVILAAMYCRIVTRQRSKELVLTLYLRGWSYDTLNIKAQHFVHTLSGARLRLSGIKKLREHQQAGDVCVLVSASPMLYLHYWASQYGIEHCLATVLVFDEQQCFTGRIAGYNCRGEEKVRRINRLAGKKLSDASAYGDSTADMPMLRAVTYGFIYRSGDFYPID